MRGKKGERKRMRERKRREDGKLGEQKEGWVSKKKQGERKDE